MGVTSGPTSTSRLSDVLCAGSDETSKVLNPRSARRIANAHEVVVFPTPPLPPNRNRRVIPCLPFTLDFNPSQCGKGNHDIEEWEAGAWTRHLPSSKGRPCSGSSG